jgi:hypothetical protein
MNITGSSGGVEGDVGDVGRFVLREVDDPGWMIGGVKSSWLIGRFVDSFVRGDSFAHPLARLPPLQYLDLATLFPYIYIASSSITIIITLSDEAITVSKVITVSNLSLLPNPRRITPSCALTSVLVYYSKGARKDGRMGDHRTVPIKRNSARARRV